MKLFQLGKGVAQYYRQNIKGNNKDDLSTIQRKLTRNILLSKKAREKYPHKKLYIYGNLEILVKDNTIVWLNNSDKKRRCYINTKKKAELNQKLGIGR